ncbi:kinesin-like protein KIF28P [Sarcoramphus papa]
MSSERQKGAGNRCGISRNTNSTSIHDPRDPGHRKTFTLHLAFWSHSGFDLGQGVLENAWQGYKATLLAYGQTGSGKSSSMMGYSARRGLVPIACKELALQSHLESGKEQAVPDYFSMLEVYNEQVRDLLSKTRKRAGLKIREDQQQGFQVAGLKLVPCDIYARIESLMEEGTKMRTRAMTTMNATSSRSHVVITTQFQQIVLDEAITKQSVINPVAFVGSERQKSSGSERERLKEGTPVNLSLTTLGNVLSALAEAATGKRVLHIPSRDLLLTKLLPSALGGNSRTIMIAAVSPADICYEETLSTLPYAERYTFVISPSLVLVRTGVRCWAKRPKIPVQSD